MLSRMVQILFDLVFVRFTRTSSKWLHSRWKDESTKIHMYQVSLVGDHWNNVISIFHLSSTRYCWHNCCRPVWRPITARRLLYWSFGSTFLLFLSYSATIFVCIEEGIWIGRKLVRILHYNKLLYSMFTWTNGCLHENTWCLMHNYNYQCHNKSWKYKIW